MSRGRILFFIVLVQCLFLLGWAVYEERQLGKGFEVLLEVDNSDPNDFFQGDYVRLRYPGENLPQSFFPPDADLNPRRTAYVFLAPGDNGMYTATHAELERPAPDRRPFLRAEIRSLFRAGECVEPPAEPHEPRVRLDYGIGRFYVPEGKGVLPQDSKVAVRVVLAPDGRARIRELLVDGEPWPPEE